MPTSRDVARSASSTSLGGSVPSSAWRWVAAAEVALAAWAVAAGLAIPSLVLVAMAAVSLGVRRCGPATLGLRRPARPWRLVAEMAAFAGGWTVFNVALLIPVVNHLSGQRQDVSAFADLQDDVGLLLLYLAAGWVVAALGEEVAFRGYLLTRLTEVLGRGAAGLGASVVGSSVLFGMLHTEQGIKCVVASAVAGGVFCLLRLQTCTLWGPVLAHGFDDTIGFVWFFLFGPFYGLW